MNVSGDVDVDSAGHEKRTWMAKSGSRELNEAHQDSVFVALGLVDDSETNIGHSLSGLEQTRSEATRQGAR